ncbi:hypothetical protein GBAR_LOCUS20684, partial [Geodia barretti]
PHLLAKSTTSLGHPIFHSHSRGLFSLHTPAIVKVFRMVGWSVLPPTCLLKVQEVQATLLLPQSLLRIIFTAHSSYSQGIQDGWLVCPSPHL